MPIRNKWSIGIVLTAVALIASALVTLRQLRAPQSTALTASQARAQLHETQVQMEAIAAAAARQRLAQMPEPVVPERVDDFPRLAINAVLTAYREMLSVQGLYNQYSARDKTVAQLLKTPQGIEIAAKSLTDPKFAQDAFGTFQAEARFFSVQVLKAAALQGNEKYLVQSAGAIAQDLAQEGSRELDMGRSADLRDLVHAYVDVKGTAAFASGDTRLVETLGYAQTLPTSVKGIYDEVLFMRLKHEFGRDSAAAMLSSLLDG